MQISGWFWLVVVVAGLLVEMMSPGLFFFLSFSCGAFAAMVSTFYGDSFRWQGGIFLGATALSFFLMRRFLAHKTMSVHGHQRTNVDALMGKRVVVTVALEPHGVGQVRVDGEVWFARSFDQRHVETGAVVEIVQIVGSHVLVRKV